MTLQLTSNRRTSFARVAMIFAVMMTSIAASRLPVRGAELAEQAHSLTKVPADSAFYSSTLRIKEQVDAFVESKAYAKLMQIPLVQTMKMMAVFQLQQSPQPAIAQIREYLESPAGKDAVALVHEMFSDEVFAYGGSNIAESAKFLMELNSLASHVRVQVSVDGEKAPKEENVLKKIEEKLSSGVTVPTFVVGFRIKNTERAKRELDELHSMLRNVLDEHQPELAAHLQRDQIAGHEFLTMRLDGSMIPWEKIREQAENIDEEQFNSIRDAVSKKTLAVALGVVDEFVLLSVGPSTEHLEKIGQGETLANHPAIKRLEKHAAQKVVSLTYMSKALAESLGSPKQTLDDIATSVEQGLVEAKVDEDDRKTILDDIRAFDLAKIMPASGETSGIAYLTARGYEMFQYTTASRPMLDSSKPLSILSHVGGNPLVLLATRSKQSVEDYTEIVKWLKKIASDGEKIYEKTGDEDEVAKYKEFRDRGVALLKRLDTANRENLIPALADGQGAFVMDLTATSNQWFQGMPESPKPLPMLEMAFVTSVSDAEKLRKGVSTYASVAHDYYKLMREIDADETPKIKWPKFKSRNVEGVGKIYIYPLPKDWGVDPQVAVNAGMNDKIAAVSLMPATTQRLLQEQKSSIDTALPLDHPAALIAHFEFAKMIDATRPWIDYGLDVAMGKLKTKAQKEEEKEKADDSDDNAPPQPPSGTLMSLGLVVPQFQQFLDFASALRSATTMTYEEDGVWVTHSETHIEDLK
jgi:hypothetical protein